MSEFNFEEWRLLAQDSPEKFFRRREEIISAFIEARPESREALQALQQDVDRARAIAGTPPIAARVIARMLEGHLKLLTERVSELRHMTMELESRLRDKRC